MIGVAISIGVGLHAISHLACDFPRLIHATEEEYKPMEQFFGKQAKNYWHFVKEPEGYTGIIMVVLMAIAFTLATPWLRRGKLNLPSFLKKLTGFNAFWYSHHLFVIVYTLLIVHGFKLYLTKKTSKKTVSFNVRLIFEIGNSNFLIQLNHDNGCRHGCTWLCQSSYMRVRD